MVYPMETHHDRAPTGFKLIGFMEFKKKGLS
jgi:hypothetical protein